MDGPYTEGEVNSRGDYVPTSDEVTAYQAARIPWANQVKYGYYTLAFLSSILVAFTIVRAQWHFRTRYGYGSRWRLYTLTAAYLRILTYPRFRPHSLIDWVWTFGPLGPNLLLFAGLVFASCFTWINQYYYFPPFYGSAPLYLRSEWIAMATLPFLFVLGSKRNIISILTSVSHEKLQVLHQGAAFIFVYMILVHTIAAVIRLYREYGYLALEYNDSYVSGFVALSPLLVLFVGALPPFRKRFYEAFYWVHIIMAVFFLGAMFWHGYQTLDSDAYMITTIVLFFASAAYRIAMFAFNNPVLHVATATTLSRDVIKLSVPTTAVRWQPGQHVFLRFLGLRPFESHPFSFATMPIDHTAQVRTMDFIVRPQSGFTRALFEHVRKTGRKDFAVLIDGPYGGVGSDLRAFDSVLICAGGSGITWAMSCLQDMIQAPRSMKQVIKLVWAVPTPDDLTWFEQDLLAIVGARSDVQIQLYVTRDSTSSGASTIETQGMGSTGSDEAHGSYENKEGLTSIATTLCRPDLCSIITGTVASTEGSLVVATCGPPSFLADCANTVAAAQISLIRGHYPQVS